MNTAYSSHPFAGSGFGAGGAGPASAIFEAMDQLRRAFDPRPGGGSRMARGDVRTAVLTLLAEKPMHGYQIINEIAERSGGSWKPSAGSVYPTLQLLADEGLIEAVEHNDRKTYSLTEAGRDVAAESADQPAPWESSAGHGESRDSARFSALPQAGVELAAAAAQVGRSGNPEQIRQTIDVLDDARRKLYSILAQG